MNGVNLDRIPALSRGLEWQAARELMAITEYIWLSKS